MTSKKVCTSSVIIWKLSDKLSFVILEHFSAVLKSLILVLIYNNSNSNKDRSSTSVSKFFLFSQMLQFQWVLYQLNISLQFFLIINLNNFYLSKNINGIWYKRYCNRDYMCTVKMFCRASFTPLMGTLKHNISFKYS